MMTKNQFKEDYIKKLSNKSAKSLDSTSDLDKYNALSSLIREYMTKKWIETNQRYNSRNVKQVYYFSIVSPQKVHLKSNNFPRRDKATVSHYRILYLRYKK